MAITIDTGGGVSEVEVPLLNDVVRGFVDFKGRPSLRSISGSWKSASFIIGVEMAERLSYYGISSNLVSYLTERLGQSTAAAAANLNAWYGTAALSPILGALLADSYLGRYRTIIYSSLLYILGLGFLTLSAAFNSLNSSPTYKTALPNSASYSPPLLQTTFFFSSLYLVALAQGGHRPCLQAFGADQFDPQNNTESKAKSSFFNWCFWSSCFGTLIALSVLNYIQENLSWEVGFGIPCVVMCLGLIVFWIGNITYRFCVNEDGRSFFVRISWVFVKMARDLQPVFGAISNEAEAQRITPQQCAQFEFLDIASLVPNGPMEDERTCTVDDFQETKAILRLAPVWFTSLGYSIIYAQPSTLFTKQASTLDRQITSTFQIPAASLQLFIVLSIIVFVPIYDCILVPIARAITEKSTGISKLQRIGIGLFLSFTSIVVAALVEWKRLGVAFEYGLIDKPKAIIPMSIWWLAPQYLISGIANVFTLAGLQEFFYDEVSSELKSIGLALYLSILGIGSFLSSFLICVIHKGTSGNGEDGWFSDNLNRAHLDYFYWLLAGISAFLLAAYVYFAKTYVYRSSIETIRGYLSSEM